MSRIEAAASGHLSMLQRLAVSAIDELARSLTRSAGVSPGAIDEFIVVGNTTMLHLLLGVDPGPLGRSPFRPVFKESRELAAQPDFQMMFLDSLSFPGEQRLSEAISGFQSPCRTLVEGAGR